MSSHDPPPIDLSQKTEPVRAHGAGPSAPAPAASLPPPADRNFFARIGRALRHRNYRLFFGGQLISLIGNFLTSTAMSWMVLLLTAEPSRRPAYLALIFFAGQIPVFILGPFAGVWVDRLQKRRLIVTTQTLAMLQSFALAELAFTHTATIPILVVLALYQGTVNAFDIPGRQAFMVDMVTDREDLANAIALNSTMVHFARLVGPAAAGLMIAGVGIGWCFLLDALSYLAVIAALLAMIITPRAARAPRSVLHELAEGARYVAGFAPIRVLLLLMSVYSLTAMPALMTQMPIFAYGFGGNARGAQYLGFLGAASGLGALIGALLLAARRTVLGLGRLIAVASAVFAISLALFAICNHLWLALLILPFCGWGMITNFASANTILQTLTEDHMRGRVMSFFSMSFIGVTPLGALLVGYAATRLGGDDPVRGASLTMVWAAVVCIIASILYWRKLPELRKLVLPIYAKKGIVDEVAAGLQAAAELTDPAEA
jgi:MFS family permease